MAEEEAALDIEETNRLRAKLGLKPLNLAPAGASKVKQQAPKEQQAVEPEELRAKVTAAREKRRREHELRKTKTLGEADEDVDDVANWIQKIKPGQQQPAAAAGEKPSKRQRRAAAAADDDQEHTISDLAGVSVKHDMDDLAEGETVVLTLADAGILDAKGNLADGPDQLIDTLAQQEKSRRKARAAATKTAKPLWEEDGKVRGLLEKYDEEEEENLTAFDASGQLQQQRQQELRSKLAAGAALLNSADGSSAAAAAGDYYTPEEAAALKGDKKKKKKRKLRTTKVEEEEAGGLDLDALEAAAAEGPAAAADLGSREAREARRQQQEAARATAVADRAARFEAALGRANIASESLRQPPAGSQSRSDRGDLDRDPDRDLDADEADDELAVSLARARRLVQKAAQGSSDQQAAATDNVAAAAGGGGGGSSFEDIARQLAKKREEDEAKLREQIAAGVDTAFTETSEFVRSIQVEQPKAADDSSSYMDVDELPTAAAAAAATPVLTQPEIPAAAKVPRQRNLRKGGWTTVEGEDEQADQELEANGLDHHRRRPAPELEDTGVVGERAMGKGLAATLALLKDKGTLKDKIQWAGRTNDKKPVALIGLQDVYTGGSHEEAMAQRIEVALTQKDEFGRVMTPKERFRVMCHQFHGMAPSKNKQEERQRKYLEEVAVAQATSSENPSARLDQMKELQKVTGTAYVPLTGKLKPGAGGASESDRFSGLASARTGTAATPVLGGGLTPLVGNKKVEMMLGISKGGGGMPPPAPRR